MTLKSLYLCYFSLREPLVQTQVLPYLRQLASAGYKMHILTFERTPIKQWPEGDVKKWQDRLADDGITWHALTYHQRPTLPATLYDIANGARMATKLVRRYKIDLLHARSHVATAMGALAKKRTGAKLLFDIRGFFPEEYVDAGRWPENGFLYRSTKRVERRLYDTCDGAVVLTEKAKQLLHEDPAAVGLKGKPVQVIPCCVDFDRFAIVTPELRAEVRAELGIDENRPVQVYVGALDGWYLTDELAECLACAHQLNPAMFTMVLTQSPREILTSRFQRLGIPEKDYFVSKVDPTQVPRYLSAADYAVSMIKPCYSKQASSPTKVAEYLACGLPVLSNAEIGDLDALIEGEEIGVLVRDLKKEGFRNALIELEKMRQDPDLADRCRRAAVEFFDLRGVGGEGYRNIYFKLIGPAETRDKINVAEFEEVVGARL